MKQFIAFLRDECGQGVTEYGLILVFASIAALALFRIFATEATEVYHNQALFDALGGH